MRDLDREHYYRSLSARSRLTVCAMSANTVWDFNEDGALVIGSLSSEDIFKYLRGEKAKTVTGLVINPDCSVRVRQEATGASTQSVLKTLQTGLEIIDAYRNYPRKWCERGKIVFGPVWIRERFKGEVGEDG